MEGTCRTDRDEDEAGRGQFAFCNGKVMIVDCAFEKGYTGLIDLGTSY